MHGLSTAYHLAKELRARGLGSGHDVVVLDKSTPGAGATGIACGVVRNNYFQPAMSELMQACVEVWESDPEAYHYNPVGYIALGPQVQEPDLTAVYERQERIGYRSELYLGEAEVDAHMKALFPDWRAQGRDRLPARAPGRLRVQHRVGARPARQVPGRGRPDPLAHRGDGLRARRRRHRRGRRDRARAAIEVGEQVVIAPGPWAKRFWALLGLPDAIDVHTPSGDVVRDQPMWTYWNLQEGEITVDPLMFATADGGAPPVIHLDTDAPLYTDDGELVTDELWGIYFKRDRHGVQGGASPLTVDGDVELDPYPATTDVDDSLPGHVVRGALARDVPLRGLPAALQEGALGRRRRVHGRQLPGLRLPEAERLRRSSTRTTATR